MYLKTVDEYETEYTRHWNLYKDREGAARTSYEADQFEVLHSASVASYIADNYLVIRKAFADKNMVTEYQDYFVESPVEICLKCKTAVLQRQRD